MTLTEFQATRKTFDLDADQPDEHQFQADLAVALDSTGWADFDILDQEGARAVHFYEFTHSDNPEPARYIIVVVDGKGKFVNAWTMGSFGFDTLEAAEADLLGELNG